MTGKANNPSNHRGGEGRTEVAYLLRMLAYAAQEARSLGLTETEALIVASIEQLRRDVPGRAEDS
jgi:hypothetical protein